MNQAPDNPTHPHRLLSIVTVTRNDAQRLAKTIRSLTAYYGDDRFEHVVMDGGSTDHTDDVVGSLSGNGNFHFYSGYDKGIYDAMNQGVAKSRGRFILFLNCGDCMLASPDEVDTWIKSAGDGETTDILCFAFMQTEADGTTKVIQARKGTRWKMPSSHQAMLFSAGFMRRHPYNIDYRIAADYDLYTRSRQGHVVIAPTPDPLTSAEADGVASSQPTIAYREYLRIASTNLKGAEMIACVTRIGLKALLVTSAKSLLPSSWIRKLRRIS